MLCISIGLDGEMEKQHDAITNSDASTTADPVLTWWYENMRMGEGGYTGPPLNLELQPDR